MGCVWLKRILDLSARSWAEEEEKQSRLFQQTRHPVWGEGKPVSQAAQRKEVNKRVLKELVPIHYVKKKIFSQLSGFPFPTTL